MVASLVNDSGLPDNVVLDYLQNEYRELAKVGQWVKGWGGSANRRQSSTIFNQDRYTIPENIFDQMATAADAAKYDDAVSNAIEVTEQLAFKRLGIDSGNDDESNIGSQILDDLDMIQRMREIWRELFAVSQCYVAVKWGRKTYRVKTKKEGGRSSRKVYKDILVPTGISILDPLKILPVGNFMFQEDRLVYIASPDEVPQIDQVIAGANTSDLDTVVRSLFDGKYKPTEAEKSLLSKVSGFSVDFDHLYLLNSDNVFRITSTRPSYQRFADVRMTSIFELLDLKHNLRESDRSDILGNLNCIVVVKKGTDELPAEAHELEQVAAQMKSHSRNSVLITDHRVDIEILTKKTDKTLQPERYNTLDSRITARLFQILQTGNYAAGTAMDDSGKLFKVIAASMEARRELIRDNISNKIIERIWELNDKLTGDPDITFHPRRIALEFDHNYTQLLVDLMTSRTISRNTILDELDIDIDQEATRIRAEKDTYSDIWADDPNMSQGTAGRVFGGNSNGGGNNLEAYQPSPSNEPKAPAAADKSK